MVKTHLPATHAMLTTGGGLFAAPENHESIAELKEPATRIGAHPASASDHGRGVALEIVWGHHERLACKLVAEIDDNGEFEVVSQDGEYSSSGSLGTQVADKYPIQISLISPRGTARREITLRLEKRCEWAVVSGRAMWSSVRLLREQKTKAGFETEAQR